MDIQTIFRSLQIKTFISVYFNLDSVLVGIVYKDLHEILKSNSSNNDATNNSRYLANTFTDGKIIFICHIILIYFNYLAIIE